MDLVWTVCLGIMPLVIGQSLDGCAPPDPNCHPSCIVYDARHCRLCRCASGSNDYDSSSWSSGGMSTDAGGMSTDAKWDKGFDGDWQSKMSETSAWEKTGSDVNSNSWQNTGSSGSFGGRKETSEVRYLLVENPEPERIYPSDSNLPSLPFGGRSAAIPFHMTHGSSLPMSPALLPGTSRGYTAGSHSSVVHVPLISPGQPRYCVRCHILSCPSMCERIDEYGCHSCPCAPSRFETMPVMRDCATGRGTETQVVERKPDCRATKLCVETCRDGYKLGGTGRDGCRECSCIKVPPKPKENGCPATISCMLKCKNGYVLGETQRDGCQSCKCLAKGINAGNYNTGTGSGSSHNNQYGNNGNGGKSNGMGSSLTKGGSNNWNSNSGSSSHSNNMLTSSNGVGDGKCEPPMCLNGHMSVDQAMKLGTDSSHGRYTSGMTSGTTSPGSNSGSSNGNKENCYPMCAGGSNKQYSSGNGMSSSSSDKGTGSGNSGCSGPFCATMSGMGSGGGGRGGMGGMGMGNGGGGGGGGGSGMPFSPFSAAMSGGAPGAGISPGGNGSRKAGIGTNSAGGNGSRKAEIGTNSAENKECPNLMHCLVTCDGRPLLGDLDKNGCQSCTCA